MNGMRGRTLLERLPTAAVLAALALLLVAPAVLAEEPLRYNCPDGFVWIRMSGTACVQETVPTNGKIGYDGHALCIDPYVGVYETRGTTDGKGVPGNPASSYAYLLECVTQQEFAARQAAGTGGDLTRLLAGRPTQLPDAEDLVVIGLTATGGILLAASLFRPAAKPPAPAPGIGAEVTLGADGTADTPVPLPTDPEGILRRLDTLAGIDKDLARVAAEIRDKARANQLTTADYATFVGILADLAGAIPEPHVQAASGVISISANLTSLIADIAGWDERAVYRDVRGRLDDIARLRGIIAAETDALRVSLETAGQQPPPEPGRIDLDPAVMPDEMLREERDRAQQRTFDTHDAMVDAGRRADDLRARRNQVEDQVRGLQRILDRIDSDRESTGRTLFADEGAWANLLGGIDGLVQMSGEKAAGRTVDQLLPRILEAGLAGQDLTALGAELTEAQARAASAARRGGLDGKLGIATALQSGSEWWRDWKAEQARALVERAIEGKAFLAGRLDEEVRLAEGREALTRQEFDREFPRRDALRAEYDRRALERGHVLWTQ